MGLEQDCMNISVWASHGKEKTLGIVGVQKEVVVDWTKWTLEEDTRRCASLMEMCSCALPGGGDGGR